MRIQILAMILTAILINSCTSKSEQVNKNFLRNYQKEIEEINAKRDALLPKDIPDQKPTTDTWRDYDEIIGVSGTTKLKSGKFDTSKLKLAPPPEEFTPDANTLLEGKVRHLPETMFDINYPTENAPLSYKKPGISFDDIKIPLRDAFGVATELGEKDYNLVDKSTLQKNIDYINSRTTEDDKDISRILIEEQKELKTKRRLGIFDKKTAAPKEEATKNEDKKEGDVKDEKTATKDNINQKDKKDAIKTGNTPSDTGGFTYQ